MAKTKKKVFAVFGLGTFGQRVATVLAEKGGEVIVLDNNAAHIEAFKNRVTSAILIDSTDEKALMKAPLDDVDTAIVAIGESVETSIITTALLKQRGIPYIVSRAISNIHAQILHQIGANEVINLQEEEGTRIAQRLIAPEVLDTIPISKDFSIAEVYVPSTFIGKPVSDMALEIKFSVQLVAIKRIVIDVDSEGNPIRTEEILFPKGVFILQDSDILILVGKNRDLDELRSIL